MIFVSFYVFISIKLSKSGKIFILMLIDILDGMPVSVDQLFAETMDC